VLSRAQTGGSAIGLSATDAWARAAAGDGPYISIAWLDSERLDAHVSDAVHCSMEKEVDVPHSEQTGEKPRFQMDQKGGYEVVGERYAIN